MSIQLSEEKSPCEKFDCDFFYRCGFKKLACEAFVYFYQYGRAAHPHTMWRCKGERHISYQNPDMKPTKELYRKVFEEPEVILIKKETRGRKADKLNELSRFTVLDFIKANPGCDNEAILKKFNCSKQAVANHIHKLALVDGLITRTGKKCSFTYEAIK